MGKVSQVFLTLVGEQRTFRLTGITTSSQELPCANYFSTLDMFLGQTLALAKAALFIVTSPNLT